MSFGLYLLGTVVLIIGVLFVCHLTHMSTTWMGAIAVVLLGAGIMGAVTSTRGKDPN